MRRLLTALATLFVITGTVGSAQTIVGDRLRISPGPCMLRSGSGTPNGSVTGNICDMYIDTATGVWYTKWTGTATNTGWGVGHNANATVNGNTALNGTLDVTGLAEVPGYASQITGWQITSAGSADFRFIYADELHAKSFIADFEQALAGGQIISKSVAVLSSNFTCPAAAGTATLTVEDLPGASAMRVFEINDWVVVRSFSRAAGALTIGDCAGVVTSPTTPGGTQTWTFTRGTGGSAGTMAASTVVTAKNLALDYGISGNGYYEVNAVDGTYGINSPYSQTVTWATAPVAANRTVRTRVGNLRGITSSTEYGAILGTYGTGTAQYVRMSDQASEMHNVNLSMFSGSTEVIKLDRTAPSLAIGSPVPSAYGTGSGIWMGNDAGAYKFRVGNPAGNRITWDGTSLSVFGDGSGVTNINGANIQTGSVSAAKLTIGTGRNMVRNSDCQVGTEDWTTIFTNSGLPFALSSNLVSWNLNNGSVCYVVITSGTPAINQEGQVFSSHRFPAIAGNYYEASVYFGTHRAQYSRVGLLWLDAAGSIIAVSYSGTGCGVASPGGLALSGFCRSAVIAPAPAGTVTATLFFDQVYDGVNSTPYMFWVHAYFGEALPNQTEYTPWGPGGMTEITGGVIRTGTITALNIAAHSITATELSVGTLSAISANLGTVTAGSLTIGGSDKIWLNDAGDGRIAVGGSTKGSAPFLVLNNGNTFVTNFSATNLSVFNAPIVNAFGSGGNRTVCVNNAGTFYVVGSGVAC